MALTMMLVAACTDRGGPASSRSSLGSLETNRATAVNTSLTTVRRLLSDALATDVSPDGRHILFVDGVSRDVAVRDLLTGDVRRLTHNSSPVGRGEAYSPRVARDGLRVAYAWLDGQTGAFELRVSGMDGNEARTIYAWPHGVFPADWSPDGTIVLAARWMPDGTQQIVLVPADSGAVRVLKTLDWRDPIGLSFSPDGRFIAYSHAAGDSTRKHDIYVLAADGSRETRIVRHPADDRMFGWTPDGRHILFSSDRGGAPGAWLLSVADGNARSDPVLLTSGLWRSGDVGFSDDGMFFYWVERGGRQIYLSAIDSITGKAVGSPRQITRTSLGRDTRLDWSPDGRSIAYQIRDGLDPVVMAIHSLETGDTREIPLPARAQFDKVQRWLPNANALLVRGFVNGRGGVFRLDVQTGKVDELLSRPVYSFDVTPDGRSIVFLRDSTISVRDIASGTEREVYQATEGWIVRPWVNTVSPDGSRLAFFRKRKEMPESELTVIPLAGGPPARVATARVGSGVDGSALAWSKDGRWLIFTTADSGSTRKRVWRVAVRGGKPEPAGLEMEELNEIRFSPTAWRVAFTAGVSHRELWVMENIPTR